VWLRPKNGFTVGERETHVEQAGKLHRFFQAIQPHAAGAEVHALDTHFIALLVLQRNGNLDAGAEEFLLLEADESQRVRSIGRIYVDVVFLQLSAERAARDAEL